MIGACFPPIRDAAGLPRKVLVVVAHPDDEIIGAGALLGFHGARGDEVRVVHVTDGAGGDPEGRFGDIAARRRAEGDAALAALGLGPAERFDFPDGGLAGRRSELERAMRDLFREAAPALLYTFHGGEFHPDHRAVAAAACAARGALPRDCRILLFGVNQPPAFASLYDYSARVAVKERALRCFETQLSYLDFATKVMQRDRAATVNVELPGVTHAEPILEVRLDSWAAHVEHQRAALADAEECW